MSYLINRVAQASLVNAIPVRVISTKDINFYDDVRRRAGRAASLSARNSSQFPGEEIERSAGSNLANWIPSLDGQKPASAVAPVVGISVGPGGESVSRSVDSTSSAGSGSVTVCV